LSKRVWQAIAIRSTELTGNGKQANACRFLGLQNEQRPAKLGLQNGQPRVLNKEQTDSARALLVHYKNRE